MRTAYIVIANLFEATVVLGGTAAVIAACMMF